MWRLANGSCTSNFVIGEPHCEVAQINDTFNLISNWFSSCPFTHGALQTFSSDAFPSISSCWGGGEWRRKTHTWKYGKFPDESNLKAGFSPLSNFAKFKVPNLHDGSLIFTYTHICNGYSTLYSTCVLRWRNNTLNKCLYVLCNDT